MLGGERARARLPCKRLAFVVNRRATPKTDDGSRPGTPGDRQTPPLASRNTPLPSHSHTQLTAPRPAASPASSQRSPSKNATASIVLQERLQAAEMAAASLTDTSEEYQAQIDELKCALAASFPAAAESLFVVALFFVRSRLGGVCAALLCRCLLPPRPVPAAASSRTVRARSTSCGCADSSCLLAEHSTSARRLVLCLWRRRHSTSSSRPASHRPLPPRAERPPQHGGQDRSAAGDGASRRPWCAIYPGFYPHPLLRFEGLVPPSKAWHDAAFVPPGPYRPRPAPPQRCSRRSTRPPRLRSEARRRSARACRRSSSLPGESSTSWKKR